MKSRRNKFMKVKRTLSLVNEATVSVDQAIDAVSHIGGIIFDVRLKETDERLIWRIKMVRGGERAKIHVDAKSGLIIEANAEAAVTEENFV